MQKLVLSIVTATTGLSLMLSSPVEALTKAEAVLEAKNLYERIARTPGTERDITLMANLIMQGKTDQAAFIAMNDLNFYKLNLRKMFTKWSNRDKNPNLDLNDMSATLVGYVLNNRPFHGILHEEIIYTGSDEIIDSSRTDSDNPLLRTSNRAPDEDSGLISALISDDAEWEDNNHYEQLQSNIVDWPNRLQARNLQEIYDTITDDGEKVPPMDRAGILTMRQFSSAAFSAGTNRRQVKLIADTFLCRPLEQMHDTNLSFQYVRQDIERTPDGDARNFRNTCAGCHAGMDAMANAFIRMDYMNNRIEYTTDLNEVGEMNGEGKLFRSNAFSNGFDPRLLAQDENNKWWNLWASGQNADLGWRMQPFAGAKATSVSSGTGAKALGAVLASSEAFSNCMVKRAFKNVCGREPNTTEDTLIKAIGRKFEQGIADYDAYGAGNGYNLKAAFAQVSTMCFGSK